MIKALLFANYNSPTAATFALTPINEIENLLDNLPLIEQRNHLPTASLGMLYARSKSSEASSDARDYLPNYAQAAGDTPAWVRQDIEAGLKLGVIGQDLVDLLMN